MKPVDYHIRALGLFPLFRCASTKPDESISFEAVRVAVLDEDNRYRKLRDKFALHAFSGITVNDVIEHFRLKELIDKGENSCASATRDRYESYLNRWIAPRWGGEELVSIKTPIVEEWLEDLKFDPNWRLKKKSRSSQGTVAKRPKRVEMQVLSPASKTRIRDLMSVLFNHAIRWGFTDRNPISGPVKGSGVRQSSKQQSIPDILEVSEMQAIIAESSQKPVPMDEYTTQDLQEWYRLTPYREPDDWVFASDSSRAGKKRGR